MEKSTDSPNRYKNRGGTLLQEERERNKLQKKITLLESELREKATSFFERTGKTFYTWGQTIDEMIMAIHNQQENVIILFIYNSTPVTQHKIFTCLFLGKERTFERPKNEQGQVGGNTR